MLVNIRETLERVVEVESVDEAERLYHDGLLLLRAEDLKEVEITEYKK